MAFVFFDTSALLHLCMPTVASSLMGRLWNQADGVFVSRIADVELHSALASGARSGVFERQAARAAVRTWQELAQGVRVVEYTPVVAQAAARVADTLPVRGADAIHLASAAQLGAANVVLACFDPTLTQAAKAFGLRVVPGTPATPGSGMRYSA
jgi:predicted nucleic acid-binding protein